MAYYRPYDRTMPWGVKDSEPEEIVAEVRAGGWVRCRMTANC